MKKRFSNLRKTIGDPEDLKQLSNMTSVSSEHRKNTDRNVYYSNSLYKRLCLLCDKRTPGGSVVTHYVKEHPDHEVLISRPSPEMVNRIKQQKFDEFQFHNLSKKITGICYFGEENKTFTKPSWEKHLLIHTGELRSFCSECNTESTRKGEHTDCDSLFENIYTIDENTASDSNNRTSTQKNDYPLRCYICKTCNYAQIKE